MTVSYPVVNDVISIGNTRDFSLRIRLDIPNMHKEFIIVRYVIDCEHDASGI